MVQRTKFTYSLLSYVKPEYFCPQLMIANINSLDTYQLRTKYGIEAYCFDADQTLCSFHAHVAHPLIKRKFWEIKSAYPVCIISNSTDQRKDELQRMFDVYVVRSNKTKPNPEPFEEASRHLRIPPNKIVMVGDRLFTDIVGANIAGFYSVLVDPIDPNSEPIKITTARNVERLLLSLYQKSGY